MKKILIIIFSIYSIMGMSQGISYQHNAKQWKIQKGIEFGGAFLSGIAYGYNQVQRHHFHLLQAKHPNINEAFWGPDQWKNKYKNGDPSQGRKFFGSTTFLVQITDAHHLTMAIDHISSIGGIIIGQAGMQRQKWYFYAAEYIGLFIIRGLGFALVTHYYSS